jgi:hypothetical protein
MPCPREDTTRLRSKKKEEVPKERGNVRRSANAAVLSMEAKGMGSILRFSASKKYS